MELKIDQRYENTVCSVLKKISESRGFRFAVLADSHLDNSFSSTAANIAAVDEKAGFKCLVHLGDFLNGNLSRYYTAMIMRGQTDMLRKCIHEKYFYPVQGNHDGYTDFTKVYSPNMVTDEDWYEMTSFTEKYGNVVRKGKKPYYYADFTEEKIRMIFLCTFYYTGFYDKTPYEKIYGTDCAQVEWFEKTALDVDSDWTVMIFSHDTPFERFDEFVCIDNPRPNGNRLMEILKNQSEEKGFSVAAWFAGHFHGDYTGTVNGINFVLVGSETAYVPQLWDMPCGGFYHERAVGTPTEDLWDSAVLDTTARTLRLIRFGAGWDRLINY